jgi:hypothetical protein
MFENLLMRVKINIKNEFVFDAVKISFYLFLSIILVITCIYFKNDSPLRERVGPIFVFTVFNLWCLISSFHRFKTLYLQFKRVELGPDIRNKSFLIFISYIGMFSSSFLTYYLMATIPYIGQ